jgi:hypothetical protein
MGEGNKRRKQRLNLAALPGWKAEASSLLRDELWRGSDPNLSRAREMARQIVMLVEELEERAPRESTPPPVDQRSQTASHPEEP